MLLTKASATGNDFILIDLLDGAAVARARPEFARALCDRHEGVGADGAVFLEPARGGGADFRWDFFNADGGSAEMCGNAARAVALYVSGVSGKTHLAFETLSGLVRAEVVSKDDIRVTLAPIAERRTEPDYVFVRAGVPHACVEVPDAHDLASLRTRALAIKARPEFAAAGVNVTFFTRRGPGRLDAVTFERGVEDFTLSCGTGAVAAAFAGGAGERVEVRVPGGTLAVLCREHDPVLSGPARLIAGLEWRRD